MGVSWDQLFRTVVSRLGAASAYSSHSRTTSSPPSTATSRLPQVGQAGDGSADVEVAAAVHAVPVDRHDDHLGVGAVGTVPPAAAIWKDCSNASATTRWTAPIRTPTRATCRPAGAPLDRLEHALAVAHLVHGQVPTSTGSEVALDVRRRADADGHAHEGHCADDRGRDDADGSHGRSSLSAVPPRWRGRAPRSYPVARPAPRARGRRRPRRPPATAGGQPDALADVAGLAADDVGRRQRSRPSWPRLASTATGAMPCASSSPSPRSSGPTSSTGQVARRRRRPAARRRRPGRRSRRAARRPGACRGCRSRRP